MLLQLRAQLIEKYKKKGCLKLYEVAAQIEQVGELFASMENSEAPPDKPESFKKCLGSLGDSMFVCTSGVRKVAVSRSLL